MKGPGLVTVTIWPFAVSAERIDALRAILSPDEQERVRNSRSEAFARELIVSRGVVRELLAQECDCSPRAISFGIGKHGKPHLENSSRSLAFNLSHSGGYCALATGDVVRLGVDIEAIRTTVGDLAKSVFSPGEMRQYASIAETDRMRAFFRAWVAKEAYLKATGEGLAGGLTSLEVDVTARPELSASAIRGDTAELARWQFRGFDVHDGIVGAVAIETNGQTIDVSMRVVDGEGADRDPSI